MLALEGYEHVEAFNHPQEALEYLKLEEQDLIVSDFIMPDMNGIEFLKEAQAILTSAETKLFLSQDKSEIEYLREVFKLSEGEKDFLLTCGRGEGLLRIGGESAVIAIKLTQREFEFVETNLTKLIEMKKAKQAANN